MSRIKGIRKVPTVIDNRHESLNRSWRILQYVQELLEINTPAPVVLEIIRTCYEDDLTQLSETTWEEKRDDKPTGLSKQQLENITEIWRGK